MGTFKVVVRCMCVIRVGHYLLSLCRMKYTISSNCQDFFVGSQCNHLVVVSFNVGYTFKVSSEMVEVWLTDSKKGCLVTIHVAVMGN